MTQNMHTWIATALGFLTVKFIVQWHKFNQIDNDFDFIIFIIDVIATILTLYALFYYMN